MTNPLTGRRVAALDVETYSPTVPDDEYPDFEDPGDFSMLATALAFQGEGTGPEMGADRSTVLLRDDDSAAAEVEHGREVCDVLSGFDPEVLVTFNGERFDCAVLPGRMDRSGGATVGTELRALFEGCTHLDLKHEAWERYGRYTSLEAFCREEGLPVRETRWEAYDLPDPVVGHVVERAERPYVTARDVARLGGVYLPARSQGVEWPTVEALLTDYALGDLDHLFTLAGSYV
jgi:hypothetical protein